MSRLIVEPVASRRQRKAFLELPWTLYRGDPNWIPPLRQNQKKLVGYAHHPFYDAAESQTFLASQNGTPCGRIAAIINRAHNELYREELGFFGFFESIDDQAVANSLFDAARHWLADRGIVALRGPVNPSMNYECGLLVDGFDTPPFFLMTYNAPYYARLVESYGFQKGQDLYAFWGHIEMLSKLDEKLFAISEAAAERFDVSIRPIDKSRFASDIEKFLQIYNDSMRGSWGFVPLSQSEVGHLGSELRHLIVPELAVFAEIEGKPVGSVFGVLDYNSRIKQIDGRLFPFGFLKLIRRREAIKRIRLVSTNVVQEYQRWGLGLVLLRGLVPNILSWGIEEVEFSWVLESNQLSRRSLEKGGAKRTKTYTIYDYPDAPGPASS